MGGVMKMVLALLAILPVGFLLFNKLRKADMERKAAEGPGHVYGVPATS
jgi:hypothetical protein